MITQRDLVNRLVTVGVNWVASPGAASVTWRLSRCEASVLAILDGHSNLGRLVLVGRRRPGVVVASERGLSKETSASADQEVRVFMVYMDRILGGLQGRRAEDVGPWSAVQDYLGAVVRLLEDRYLLYPADAVVVRGGAVTGQYAASANLTDGLFDEFASAWTWAKPEEDVR